MTDNNRITMVMTNATFALGNANVIKCPVTS